MNYLYDEFNYASGSMVFRTPSVKNNLLRNKIFEL